eukprot:13220983-Ditylum_brightwellii.AAC.1
MGGSGRKVFWSNLRRSGKFQRRQQGCTHHSPNIVVEESLPEQPEEVKKALEEAAGAISSNTWEKSIPEQPEEVREATEDAAGVAE